MGLKPQFITEEISELHVNGGTITSPPLGNFSLSKLNDSRFADDPELTNTLYLTPNHLDHFFSNNLTFLELK